MMTEQKLTAEQVVLLSSASALDAELAPVITHDENGEPIAEQRDLAADAASRNRDLLNMGLMMLAPVAPFLAECYPPATVDAIAGAFTAVEIKRGWDVQKYMSEELVLALVVLPPTIKAYLLGKQYIAMLKERSEPVNNPETFAPTVTDGHQ